MADYYTLLTNAGIAYETACKAAGVPIKLSQISVGDGGGTVYNPAATATALKREVWRGPLNALFQDEKNPSWLLAEVTIPPEVGGWYVREAGLWTDTGILYAIVKYPESFKPVLATSGSGKEFYIRSIFETSNAALVTLLIDDTVVKATRAWVTSYVADELAKLDSKQSVRVATTTNIALTGPQSIDGVAVVAGDRVLVKNQTQAKDNGIWIAAVDAWGRAKDADNSAEVTSALTVSVEQGTTLADTIWQLVTDGVIVIGTTALEFQNVTQGFAPINAPALINPTANTPAQFDSSQLLANSAFVRRQGLQYSGFLSLAASTALTLAEVGGLVSFSSASMLTCTLPATNTIPATAAAIITVACAGAGGLTVSPAAGGDTVNTSTGVVGSFVLGLGDTAEFIRLNGQWRLIGGTMALKYGALMSGANWLTQPQFDKTKAFATTEFAQSIGQNFAGVKVHVVTESILAADMGKMHFASAAGATTLTLPAASAVPAGASFTIMGTASGVATISRAGADNIIPQSSPVNSIALSNGDVLTFVSSGAGSWYVFGSAQLGSSAAFGASLAVNGYQKLPSGLIEQWGSVSVLDNSEQTITLPIAFPNAIFSAVVSVPSAGAAGAGEFATAGVRKNGSSLSTILVNANTGPSIAVTQTVTWRVWGN
ncbi:phage tail protein [Pseudomonas baetica]|uniref:phage tail protein n=1 Tax=Pseudomonas baetica TaxID=674054 RepID=UPI003EED460B